MFDYLLFVARVVIDMSRSFVFVTAPRNTLGDSPWMNSLGDPSALFLRALGILDS